MTHTNTLTHHQSTPASEHVFLRSKEVFIRYGWGRTKGYQMLNSVGFPRSIGGTYRLDTLIGWEERVLAGGLDPEPATADAEPTTTGAAYVAPSQTEVPDELPTRSRTRGLNRNRAA